MFWESQIWLSKKSPSFKDNTFAFNHSTSLRKTFLMNWAESQLKNKGKTIGKTCIVFPFFIVSILSDSWSGVYKSMCVEMKSFFLWGHENTFVEVEHTLVLIVVCYIKKQILEVLVNLWLEPVYLTSSRACTSPYISFITYK